MLKSIILLAFVLGMTHLVTVDSFQQQQPPTSRNVEVFVNIYNHPKTGFSCQDKNPGEYYADPATKCAVYYVCIPNPVGTLSPQSFACPNGTIFSQATRVCRPHEEGLYALGCHYEDGSLICSSEFVFSVLPTGHSILRQRAG